MSPSSRWRRFLFPLLLAILAAALVRGQETDRRRGPDRGPAWGFYSAERRDPALPNVLLMGDSILGGYRSTVVALLGGRANVDVLINPYHQASPELYGQLGDALRQGGPYAVIHFNMGLHGWDRGRIPAGQFEPLTRKLVDFLRFHAPGARLIWASTTPVTAKGRPGVLDEKINPIIVEQNRMAAEVMGAASVPIDDLYGLMSGRLQLARGDQFHWTGPGSALQGNAVAKAILADLPGGVAADEDAPAASEFFVAPQGNDANDGSKARPFATLEQARAAVRRLLRVHPGPEVVVSLRGGIYPRDRTFTLEQGDSGGGTTRVVYRSEPGETARLVGGKQLLPGWFTPVAAGSPVWGRLQPAARGQVLEINLPQHGISNFGVLQPRGMHHPGSGAMELFINRRPMPLAQWPKADSAPLAAMGVGFARVGKVVARNAFIVPGDEISHWATADQAWLHGYWGNLWADFRLPAASIDVAAKTVTLASAPLFGLKADQPFRIYNLLEEITAPGDWFLDRTTGRLYLWPTSGWDQAEIFVSTLSDDLVAMRATQGVVLDGLVLEMGWNRLLSVSGGSHNVIRGCVLRNAGTDGASIDGSDNGIADSVIEDTGDCGVRLSGGSRAELTPGGNYVRNSRLDRFSRWIWTYNPAVEIQGDGQIVANNLFAEGPHSAILFFGNDHRIELNEIHDVCLFSSDAGAIYGGRRWDFRGTHIRHNFIHDLHSPLEAPGVGDNGVYLDDCLSGIDVTGNIFYRITGDAILCNGGRDDHLENNIMVECGYGVEMTAFGVTHAKAKPGDSWNLVERLADDGVHYRAEPWASAYPRLAAIPDDWSQILAPGARWLYPEGSTFEHNLGFRNHSFIRTAHLGKPAIFTEVFRPKENVPDSDPRFEDLAALNLALKPDSPAWSIPGFERIPFEAIGPHAAPRSPASERTALLDRLAPHFHESAGSPIKSRTRGGATYAGQGFDVGKPGLVMPTGAGRLSAMVAYGDRLELELSTTEYFNALADNRSGAKDSHINSLLSPGHLAIDLGNARARDILKFDQHLDFSRGSVMIDLETREGKIKVEVAGDRRRNNLVITVQDRRSGRGDAQVIYDNWRNSMAVSASRGRLIGVEAPDLSGVTGWSAQSMSLALQVGCVGGENFATRVEPHGGAILVPREAARDFVVVVSARCAHGQPPVAEAASVWNDTARQDGPSREAERLSWWRDYWAQSWLDLSGPGADYLARLWYTTLYSYACVGGGPMLPKFNGGPGLVYKDARSWGDGYWWQNQREISFWPMAAAGHPEFTKTAVLFFNQAFASSLKNAKSAQMSGLLFREGNSPREWAAPFGENYPLEENSLPAFAIDQVSAAAALDWRKQAKEGYNAENFSPGLEFVQAIFDYVQYTGDTEVARKIAAPWLKGEVIMALNLLALESDGKWHVHCADATEQWWKVDDPAPLMAGIRWALAMTVRHGKSLGFGAALVGAAAGLLPKLAPLPTVASWNYRTERPGNFWMSPAENIQPGDELFAPFRLTGNVRSHNQENPELYAVFPFGLADLNSAAADLDRARRTFAHRFFKNAAGWSQCPVQAARLGLPETVSVILAHAQSHQKWAYGGWNSPGGKLYADGPLSDCPYFDAAGVELTALQEALLQSHASVEDSDLFEAGVIRLIPAIDEQWSGQFCLHARGGFTVTTEFQHGRVLTARFEATRDARLRVLNPFRRAAVSAGESAVIESDRIIVREMHRGDTVTLSAAAGGRPT